MGRAQLSVNVNKYALLRNSRGQNAPDLLWAVDECLVAGAQGITVHPRADQRHVRFDDVPAIAAHLRDRHPGVEYNVECALEPHILDLVHQVRPAQCTLVPVRPGEITSEEGWDLPRQADLLEPVIRRLKADGIRVSIFMDCVPEAMPLAADVGADRVELYTGPYAHAWATERQQAETERFFACCDALNAAGLGINAGHDLDRHNLLGVRDAPGLLEVSIGHAQIVRALEVGTRQSVRELLAALGW